MSITINLPNRIQRKLEKNAKAKNVSIEEYAIEILSECIENKDAFPSVDEVVDQILSTPPKQIMLGKQLAPELMLYVL